jgi:hypothetical protein
MPCSTRGIFSSHTSLTEGLHHYCKKTAKADTRTKTKHGRQKGFKSRFKGTLLEKKRANVQSAATKEGPSNELTTKYSQLI